MIYTYFTCKTHKMPHIWCLFLDGLDVLILSFCKRLTVEFSEPFPLVYNDIADGCKEVYVVYFSLFILMKVI